MKRPSYSLIAVVAFALASSHVASAQARVSLGAGGGMAGSTESSLSDGRGAPVIMGQATMSVAPLIGLGVQVDDWRHSGSNVTFATAHLQLHIPVTPFYVKIGGGVGTGDPDGKGRITGAAGQIGAAYDLTLPFAPIALTAFGNAFLGHARERSMQMVDLGLALTFR
jgi:hypothetical protein